MTLCLNAGLFIVKFRINRTPCAGSVRKPNLPGDESVSLFLRFTIVFGVLVSVLI